MLKSFLSALQFLTILPLGKPVADDRALSRSPLFFPAAGLVIGALIASFDAALSFLPLGPRSVLAVLSLAVLSGAIHLDGAADAADGLLSGKGRDEALRIMRDPRAGAMGVVTVVFIVLLKTAALNELASGRFPSLVFAALLGRSALTVTMSCFHYVRPSGLASRMAAPSRGYAAAAVVISAAIGGLFFGKKGVAAAVAVYAVVLALAWAVKRRIGGYTGDTLGLACEAAETAALLVVA